MMTRLSRIRSRLPATSHRLDTVNSLSSSSREPGANSREPNEEGQAGAGAKSSGQGGRPSLTSPASEKVDPRVRGGAMAVPSCLRGAPLLLAVAGCFTDGSGALLVPPDSASSGAGPRLPTTVQRAPATEEAARRALAV